MNTSIQKANDASPSEEIALQKKSIDEIPVWIKLLLIIISISFGLSIAVFTRQDAHPDEIFHIYTFDYYRNHWWPPNFDENVIKTSIVGNDRAYDGEIVYLIYSKPARIIWNILNLAPKRYIIYRLFNVGLLLLLLVLLLFYRNKVFNPTFIGLTILIFPQIQYLFFYANTDAWSMTMGISLFLFVIYLVRKPFNVWKFTDIIVLGFTTGLVLAARLNFFIMLFLPYIILSVFLIRSYKNATIPPFSTLIKYGGFIIILSFTIFGPLRIIFPLSIPNYTEQKQSFIEKHAYGGYNPQNPTAPGFHLAEKGVTYSELLTTYDWMNTNRKWIPTTAKSFYGLFGYYTVFLNNLIYQLALGLIIFLLVLTLISIGIKWKQLSWILKVSFISAPFLIFLNIAASLYYSLSYDYQPQGRYLFPSIIPVAFLLLGTIDIDSKQVKQIRYIVYILLYLLNIYSLYIAASSPLLK